MGDQRSLLSGLVVAQLARERLLVEVNNFVMDLQCFVGLELLAARLTHVNLKIAANKITKCQLLHFAKLCKLCKPFVVSPCVRDELSGDDGSALSF